MNSTDPLARQKPVTSVPSLAQTSSDRKHAAGPSVLARIRTHQPRSSRIPDAVFRWVIALAALSVFTIVVLIVYELVTNSKLSLHEFGLAFFYRQNWDPVNGDFGALSFIYGTIVSSVLALVLAVPLSVGVAVYITEMCPVALRAIISFLVELLAAIPSVIYGLWGIFVERRCCASMYSPSWRSTLAGPACSRDRSSGWACWPRASFWRS